MNPNKNLSTETLKLIVLISGINSIYLSILNAFSFSNFLYPSNYIFNSDLFADFIKVVVSYPGAKNLVLNPDFGLVATFTDYIGNNPYKGIDGLGAGVLTHFHLPPFTTLVSLTSLYLMHFFPPQLVFYFGLVLLVIALYKLFGFVIESPIEKLIWGLCFILSYPFLFLLQRGNLFSGITTMLIIFFTFCILKNKKILLGLICMAVAINIRPNAVFFLPILLLSTNCRWLIRLLGLFLLVTTIFVLSTFMAASIYQDYSLINFIKGLAIYHEGYIVGAAGDAYNSSFFSLLKMIFGYSWFIETIGSLSGFLIIVISVVSYINNRIDSTTLIFMLCVAYMCGSTTFADYHLLIFMLPILMIRLDQGRFNDSQKCTDSFLYARLIIFWACIFILSPKNYLFDNNGISIFVLLNPLVAIFSVSLLFLIKILPPGRGGLVCSLNSRINESQISFFTKRTNSQLEG